MLRSISASTIQANQDRAIYEAYDKKTTDDATLEYVINDLGTEPIERLRGLPKSPILLDEIFNE